MLDINLFRENPQVIEDNLKKRQMIELIPAVKKVIFLDAEWRKLLQKEEELRRQRNESSIQIGMASDSKSKEQFKDKAKKLSSEIGDSENKRKKLKSEIDEKIMLFPNILHDSVPIGASDEENQIIKSVGRPSEFSFTSRGHEELMLMHDVADFERAAKISGARFYFLKGFGVLLENAVIQFALDILLKEGFTLIRTPELLTKEAISTAISFDQFESDIYKIQGENLFLIGTAEHPLAAMHMGEIFNKKDLPLKYGGVSSCFRKEAGSHGRDTKGVYRVHQFRKVEQFIISSPEESWRQFEYIVSVSEKLFKGLELPYRLVNVCTGDIGTIAAKKIDLEVWLPARKTYGEMVSCSHCTDFQARRARLRFFDDEGKSHSLHTLNGTAIAVPRVLVALFENHQKKNGSISIPKALRPYLNNLKELAMKTS